MDGAQIGILKDPHQVILCGLFEGYDSIVLEPEISHKALGYLIDQALKRGFMDEKLGALLIITNFQKSHSSWPVPMQLLDTSSDHSCLVLSSSLLWSGGLPLVSGSEHPLPVFGWVWVVVNTHFQFLDVLSPRELTPSPSSALVTAGVFCLGFDIFNWSVIDTCWGRCISLHSNV